jgi:hypothetical protein
MFHLTGEPLVLEKYPQNLAKNALYNEGVFYLESFMLNVD